jgi:predicted ATPase
MNQQKIVLTGGPSAGKTTLLQALAKGFFDKIATVPETATILYKGGFHRNEDEGSKYFIQRAIYFVQKESEDLVCYQNPKKHIICDRGTLDGLAYWPRSEGDFFNSLMTTKEKELNRYQWIIHLDTACQSGYDLSNPIRIETPEQALLLNKKIKEIWSDHPQVFVIPAQGDFIKKLRLAKSIVEKILKNYSYNDIYNYYGRFLENN